jgi:hypothetical protein
LYPVERWDDPRTALGVDHDELRAGLTAEILRLRDSAEFGVTVGDSRVEDGGVR